MEQHSPTFKAVIFDYGGVLMAYDGQLLRLYREQEAKLGVPSGSVNLLSLLGDGRLDGDGPDLYKGEISAREVQRRVVERIALKHPHVKSQLSSFNILDEWVGPGASIHYNEAMVRAVHRLREHGFKTAVLTNNFFMDDSSEVTSTPIDRSLFDTFVESALERCKKPEPEIYQIVTDRLGVAPSDCIFLDDLAENCDGARQLGWYAIQVDPKRPNDAVAELAQLLGVDLS